MSSAQVPAADARWKKGPMGESHLLSHLLLVAAVSLILLGLLVFAQTQTQPMFKMADGTNPMDSQSARDDGGILLGALLTTIGLTLLVTQTSPLRPMHRVLPATILATVAALLMAAHFSIFTNGLTIAESRGIGIQTTFLFHDTTNTIPIATLTLSFLTLLLVIVAGLALTSLVAPRVLDDHLLRPKDLEGHRARIFVLTLLTLALGASFSRQFFIFAGSRGTPLPMVDFVTFVYALMGATLVLLSLTLTWRAATLLWGPSGRKGRLLPKTRDRRLRHFETTFAGMLLLLTTVTLIGEPVYVPATEDPVFAVSSHGVSWVFLIVMGVYLLQRKAADQLHESMTGCRPSTTGFRPDRLLVLGLIALTAWLVGDFLALLTDLSPLMLLTVRLLPLAVLLPFFTLRRSRSNHHWVPIHPSLLFAWGAISVLTGIMLWGIGNSGSVTFTQAAGGFLTPEARLLDPSTAGFRLLGSLLLVTPLLTGIGLLTSRQRRQVSPWLLVMSGTCFLFVTNAVFTIQTAARYDPTLGYTDVIVGFWAFTLATPTDTFVILTFTTLTTLIGLIGTTRVLHRGIEPDIRTIFVFERRTLRHWWPHHGRRRHHDPTRS